MQTEEKPGGESAHDSALNIRFKVDCEELKVHTDHLTVREILDLVDADPSKHYIVELGSPRTFPTPILMK